MDYLIIELEAMLMKAGKTGADLVRVTGHTPANISKIRNGRIKAIRLKTLLDICVELNCQPGDLIKRVDEKELEELAVQRARNAVMQAKGVAGSELGPTHVYVVDLSNE